MTHAASLSESLGDYLETIYHLVAEKRVARVKDIAAQMNVHKSSVTGALRALAKRKLINYDPYSFVTLTRKGEAAAKEIVYRHRVFAEFFEKILGIDPETAERNACHMEHAVEPEVLERLAEYVRSVQGAQD